MPRSNGKGQILRITLFIVLISLMGHTYINFWQKFMLKQKLLRAKISLTKLKDTVEHIGNTYSDLHTVVQTLHRGEASEKSSRCFGSNSLIKTLLKDLNVQVPEYSDELSTNTHPQNNDLSISAHPDTKDFYVDTRPNTNNLSIEVRPIMKKKKVQQARNTSTSFDCSYRRKAANFLIKFSRPAIVQYDLDPPARDDVGIQTPKLKNTGVFTHFPPKTVAVPA